MPFHFFLFAHAGDGDDDDAFFVSFVAHPLVYKKILDIRQIIWSLVELILTLSNLSFPSDCRFLYLALSFLDIMGWLWL